MTLRGSHSSLETLHCGFRSARPAPHGPQSLSRARHACGLAHLAHTAHHHINRVGPVPRGATDSRAPPPRRTCAQSLPSACEASHTSISNLLSSCCSPAPAGALPPFPRRSTRPGCQHARRAGSRGRGCHARRPCASSDPCAPLVPSPTRRPPSTHPPPSHDAAALRRSARFSRSPRSARLQSSEESARREARAHGARACARAAPQMWS